jgi:O-antigen/teichoic acid export membrane protein
MALTEPGSTRYQPGVHESHIAHSALVQQLSQVVGVITALIAVTLVGRNVSLSEFGVYGLVVSFASYLLVVQLSVEGASIRAIAAATNQGERDRAFSTALVLYASLGLAAGALIAAVGSFLVSVLGIPARLHHQAYLSVLALACVTALGWPFKVCQDALRGSQRFVAAAVAEMLSYILFVSAMAVLVAVGAPLWTLAALGGSVPVLIGFCCAIVLVARQAPFHARSSAISRSFARELLGFSAYLSAIGVADLVLYALDRIFLGLFRRARTIGLYEAVVRPHNLVRQLHGTLVLTVMPVATGYLAAGDEIRLRELAVRGTRYVLAIVLPVVVVVMVLAGPILRFWLGARFLPAETALIVMVGYWLLAANTGVTGSMLIAAGKVRDFTRYSWTVAISNLLLSLALTPPLGLVGVVLGTTIPYVLFFPYFLALVVRHLPVKLEDLAREAWVPAYLTSAVLAGALLIVRVTVPFDSLATVIGVAAVALGAAWGGYYLAWLRPSERVLVRSVLRRFAPA